MKGDCICYADSDNVYYIWHELCCCSRLQFRRLTGNDNSVQYISFCGVWCWMEDSDVDAFLCQTKLQWNSNCVGIVTKIVSF